jgi:hypothetical protein
MAKERLRNEDARGGDVIVQDSIASGKPDLPIDRDPGRETDRGIAAEELNREIAHEPKRRGNDDLRGRSGAGVSEEERRRTRG